MARKTYDHSTVGHILSESSISRFCQLRRKWSNLRISDDEHKWTDLTECEFVGEGGHEIVAFTFSRHVRLAALTGAHVFPVWLAVGPHWCDRWYDAQGKPYDGVSLLEIIRGIHDKAAFVEPLRVLIVASCGNGPFVYDETIRRLLAANPSAVDDAPFGNPRFRRLAMPVDALLEVVRSVLVIPSPSIDPIVPSDSGAWVSFCVEDVEALEQARNELPEVDCPVLGNGNAVVYAYAFDAMIKAAEYSAKSRYPVKIGHTAIRPDHRSTCQAALLRITSQIIFPEPICLLGLLRCDNGRAIEREIHGSFKDRRVDCLAKEWFMASTDEIRSAMAQAAR